MALRALALCFLFMTISAFASGRKPAVEDFVGIEVEEAQAAPHGADVLYNLEQDLNKIGSRKDQPVVQTRAHAPVQENSKLITSMAVLFLITLPLFVWAMMMNHLRRKAKMENASNIEVLENYRKERERKSDESIKKAS